jgi:hypothetical protein
MVRVIWNEAMDVMMVRAWIDIGCLVSVQSCKEIYLCLKNNKEFEQIPGNELIKAKANDLVQGGESVRYRLLTLQKPYNKNRLEGLKELARKKQPVNVPKQKPKSNLVRDRTKEKKKKKQSHRHPEFPENVICGHMTLKEIKEGEIGYRADSRAHFLSNPEETSLLSSYIKGYEDDIDLMEFFLDNKVSVDCWVSMLGLSIPISAAGCIGVNSLEKYKIFESEFKGKRRIDLSFTNGRDYIVMFAPENHSNQEVLNVLMNCSGRDLYSASITGNILLDGKQNMNITTAALHKACVEKEYILAYAGGYGNKIPMKTFDEVVRDVVDWKMDHRFHMGRNFFFDAASEAKDLVIAPAFPFVDDIDEDGDTYRESNWGSITTYPVFAGAFTNPACTIQLKSEVADEIMKKITIYSGPLQHNNQLLARNLYTIKPTFCHQLVDR